MGWPWYITVFVFDLAHAVAKTTIINRSLFDRTTVTHTCRKTNFAPCPLPSSPLLCTLAVKTSPSTAKSASKSQGLMGLQCIITSTSPSAFSNFDASQALAQAPEPSKIYSPPILQMCFKCREQGFKHRISSCRVASKSPTCSLTKTASRTAATMSSTNPVKHQRKASELLPRSLRLRLRLRVPFFATLGLRIALRLLAFLCAGAS
ncbi:hypothetical protein R3P38DRAFT_3223792 [Favolaschia claudopus]|uniref:Secreted protein n=1 Tax=Favolaschia claudopus TaxID=2862362 RepID=A0AAV9ZXE1_9AGAR